MTVGQNKSALILAGKNEYKKQKYAYDGQGRLQYLYEAPIDTKNGSPCMVTKFVYVGATTTMDSSAEFETTWNSAWDMTFP